MAADILFFGAHPDDVEWGLGGTAVLLRDRGISFAIVDLTNGEMGSRGTAGERKIEADSAADFLGATRENLHLPDCGLVDSPENRRLIASVIRRYRPKIVVAPLWEDRHPDHATAGLMVQNARLFCGLKTLDDPNPPHRPGAFLFYPIHKFHQPTFVVDTSPVFERKLDLLRIYASQFARRSAIIFSRWNPAIVITDRSSGPATAKRWCRINQSGSAAWAIFLRFSSDPMRVFLKILTAAVLFTLVTYGCDDLYARWRHEPYADIHIDRYLAVAEKFNKIDYERATPITERCIYSLFPHFGHNPCWYVTRHTLRFIPVG